MNKLLIVTPLFFLMTLLGCVIWYRSYYDSHSGAPPYGEPEQSVPDVIEPWWNTWERPEGPARVGIQIGHLNTQDHPDELEKLRNNTGASGGGTTESVVNQAVAQQLAIILEESGVVVDIFPATVTPDYWADVFIAIHADGSTDSSTTGYKFAGPWRDLTGKGSALISDLNDSYGEITGLVFDPNISRNMRGYYAFAWWRYEHSIHPMTPAVIAETGFLTNPNDRKVIVDQPDLVAKAIANPIIAFLKRESLI